MGGWAVAWMRGGGGGGRGGEESRAKSSIRLRRSTISAVSSCNHQTRTLESETEREEGESF